MFPAKAHGPTVFDFNSVGVDEAYLNCGHLEHGFLRVRCDKCHFERLVPFSCKKRGFCRGRLAQAVAPLLPTIAIADWSRQSSVAEALSPSQTQKSARPQSAMPP